MYYFTIFSTEGVTSKLTFKNHIVRFTICLLREIDSSSNLNAEILKSVLKSIGNSEWGKKVLFHSNLLALFMQER